MRALDPRLEHATAAGRKIQLRREIGVWGSFCWGYADVGADVYVALGLVIAAAQGATLLAFAIAGTVYVFVGLAYTEMAAAIISPCAAWGISGDLSRAPRSCSITRWI